MTEALKIKKRDGSLVEFDENKIINAVEMAMTETEQGVDSDLSYDIAMQIKEELLEDDVIGTVESISDRTEELLMDSDRKDVAKRYILFRQERSLERDKAWEMTDLQRDIYKNKYEYNNEGFGGFLDRVSDGHDNIRKAIKDKLFLPAGRILAGKGLYKYGIKNSYSNCFVIGNPEDNLESIFDTAKKMARTYSYGGGCGTCLGNLRPAGARVNNSAKETTGAMSFAELYSTTTGLIGQKSRRGALMLSLPVSHPDIYNFANSKTNTDQITKANISVKIDDKFMEAVKNNDQYELYFKVEDTGEEIRKTVDANELMDLIAENANDWGEPGLLLWDRVQNYHINSELEGFSYDATNPCFTGDMKLLTSDGYKTFEEINNKSIKVVNINGQESQGRVWASGEKETLKLILSNKHIIKCTPDHRFMTVEGEEVQAKDLKNKKILPHLSSSAKLDEEFLRFGFIQGDGCLTRLGSDTHKGIEVNIGEKDGDIINLFKDEKFTSTDKRRIYLDDYKEKLINLGFDASTLVSRTFPGTYESWSLKQKASFLSGCYSANGSVIKKYRVAYKTVSRNFAERLCETLLQDFGIESYITTNKAKKVQFDNGEYECRESYDVNIGKYQDLQRFHHYINFYHQYKKTQLNNLLLEKAPYVRSIESNGIQTVYDFNEPLTNWGVVEGYIAHNCGEKPLPKGGSCLLGSINFSELIKNPFTEHAGIDYDKLWDITQDAVEYLDYVLEEGLKFLPLEEQRKTVSEYRQLGVGIMGMADAFIKLGVRYGSKESLQISEIAGHTMINAALQKSSLLAKELGVYPKFDRDAVLKSKFIQTVATQETKDMIYKYGLRNAELLSIAPTGSLSTLLGVSGGIEPMYNISYTRKSETLSEDGDSYYKVYTPIAREYMDANNINKEEDLPDFFVTAMTLNYEDRIQFQGVWQKYIDSAISSTINLPQSATAQDVKDIYIKSYDAGLKGVTVFRDGCKRIGVLTNNSDSSESKDISKLSVEELQEQLDKAVAQELENDPNKCPMCKGEFKFENGCSTCLDCGYSPCSL